MQSAVAGFLSSPSPQLQGAAYDGEPVDRLGTTSWGRQPVLLHRIHCRLWIVHGLRSRDISAVSGEPFLLTP